MNDRHKTSKNGLTWSLPVAEYYIFAKIAEFLNMHTASDITDRKQAIIEQQELTMASCW